MAVMIFTMIVVMVIAVGVIAAVAMGMEGAGSAQHPEFAEAMARTARHLNGEAAPPRALVVLVDEMDEVPELSVRDLPARIRSAASSLSARSAASAPMVEPDETEALPEASAATEADEVAPVVPSSDAASEPLVTADRARIAEASAAMEAALDAAPVADPREDDPYGIWGVDPDLDLADLDEGSDVDDIVDDEDELPDFVRALAEARKADARA